MYHLAWACEWMPVRLCFKKWINVKCIRKVNELQMPWSGRLAIAFFDEQMPLREGAMPIDKVLLKLMKSSIFLLVKLVQ